VTQFMMCATAITCSWCEC